MQTVKRLIPFVWPQRRKFALSCLFGLIVAVLWGGNLTIVYPVMQVLLKEKTIQVYLDEELAKSRETQLREQATVSELQVKLAALLAASPPASSSGPRCASS